MAASVLNAGAQSVRLWRAVALGLSALAVALTAYAELVQHEPAARSVPAAHASQPAQESPAADEPAPPVAPAALETTTAPALTDRRAALRLLGERLEHAPDSDLLETANALIELGGPEAFALLSVTTRSSRSALRNAVFLALSNVDTAENRDFMRAALNGPDALAALSFFSDCRDPQALPTLERLAHSAVPELSQAALDALLAQGTPAEGALTRLLQADTELMDSLFSTPPHTPIARRALRAAAILRIHAGAINSGPVFEFLEQDLSADSREALLFAAHDPACAETACTTLARRGDAVSLASLAQLANDSDARLAGAASCALAADPDLRSRVPLERVLSGNARSVASRALAHINAPGARAI